MANPSPHPSPLPSPAAVADVLEDPAPSRLLHRRVDRAGRSDSLDRLGATITSISVVVPADGEDGESVLNALSGWQPERIRLELLVMERAVDRASPAVRSRLARCGLAWRTEERPLGGRPALLGAAAATADHEFVLAGSGTGHAVGLIEPALWHLWAEGADVALLHGAPTSESRDPDLTVDLTADAVADPREPRDAADTLATWLGLRVGAPDGGLVLMRRWAARWLFHELTRAIDPAEELADRVRLMGTTVVELGAATR